MTDTEQTAPDPNEALPPPPLHALIDPATRAVLAYGYFPTPPVSPDDEGRSVEVVALDAGQREHLEAPGTKTLRKDGTVAVTPPPPAEQQATPPDFDALSQALESANTLASLKAATRDYLSALSGR